MDVDGWSKETHQRELLDLAKVGRGNTPPVDRITKCCPEVVRFIASRYSLASSTVRERAEKAIEVLGDVALHESSSREVKCFGDNLDVTGISEAEKRDIFNYANDKEGGTRKSDAPRTFSLHGREMRKMVAAYRYDNRGVAWLDKIKEEELAAAFVEALHEYVRDGKASNARAPRPQQSVRSLTLNLRQSVSQWQLVALTDSPISNLIAVQISRTPPANRSNELGYPRWKKLSDSHFNAASVNSKAPMLQGVVAAEKTEPLTPDTAFSRASFPPSSDEEGEQPASANPRSRTTPAPTAPPARGFSLFTAAVTFCLTSALYAVGFSAFQIYSKESPVVVNVPSDEPCLSRLIIDTLAVTQDTPKREMQPDVPLSPKSGKPCPQFITGVQESLTGQRAYRFAIPDWPTFVKLKARFNGALATGSEHVSVEVRMTGGKPRRDGKVDDASRRSALQGLAGALLESSDKIKTVQSDSSGLLVDAIDGHGCRQVGRFDESWISRVASIISGGAYRIRTDDLFHAMEAR